MSRNTFWDSFTQVVMHFYRTSKLSLCKFLYIKARVFYSFSDNSFDINDANSDDDNNGGRAGKCDIYRSGI
jgi:hypothetical protein